MNADVIAIENVEVVKLELAKKHLRLDVDNDDENMLIEVAIASAITQAENYTERVLKKGIIEFLTHNAESIVIERSSLNDEVQKVEVLEEGVGSVLLPASAYSQTKRGPEIYEVSFKDVVLDPGQQLKVTIELGFDSETLPKDILSAMLLMIGDAYEKREDRNQGNNTAVNNLLRPYRKWQ
ncbi:head-tail connector protein [Myroides sp. DF42-4-2]|uniref:head-tail connector protein n=1 Tax=unclassified Myroides TaxID=2642485 RepID=UPI00257911B6|nr:head-tail connector protein [Myroides sp. DF42-4-2]MDM1408059.1 phage gp6-like head-tail connector protein [Myroides sp. DF42-4-2]